MFNVHTKPSWTLLKAAPKMNSRWCIAFAADMFHTLTQWRAHQMHQANNWRLIMTW